MKLGVTDRVIDPERIGQGRVEQGTILHIHESGHAEVRWDSGTQTIQQLDTLRPTSYPTNITPGTPDYIGYPKNDQYQWGEFALMAFELGGYSDISMVDPYTGTRFWVGDVLSDGPTWYEAMHRVIAAAEQANFIERCEDKHGLREEARLGRPATEQETRQAEMRQRHEQERDALMRRHVEERNEFFLQYENPPMPVVPRPDGADSPAPAA